MSISSIGSSQVYQPQMSNLGKSSAMSSEQSAFVKDLLSQYDSSSLSENDAKEIVKSLQEAGIGPSQALQSVMSASGFDAEEIGSLAGVTKNGGGEKPMGPPPPKKEEMSSISDLLESLLSTDDEDSSSTSSTSSLDTILDYTSKIVSLKEDAKAQVMDILNKYNAENNTLSQEDTQKVVVNSLNQILKESDNYNTMSFYA